MATRRAPVVAPTRDREDPAGLPMEAIVAVARAVPGCRCERPMVVRDPELGRRCVRCGRAPKAA
jgi:hypothetical protein